MTDTSNRFNPDVSRALADLGFREDHDGGYANGEPNYLRWLDRGDAHLTVSADLLESGPPATLDSPCTLLFLFAPEERAAFVLRFPSVRALVTAGSAGFGRTYTDRHSLKDLTREDVVAVIEQCDKVGAEAFLATHGYRPSLRFFLKYRNRRYPSKAIVGVALGVGAKDFSGGQQTVGKRLEALGFTLEVLPRGGK